MAAIATEPGSSEAAIMETVDPEAGGEGQPMPIAEVQEAIAGAFPAAGAVAPGSAESAVSTTHLAHGCLETSTGTAISNRLGLRRV